MTVHLSLMAGAVLAAGTLGVRGAAVPAIPHASTHAARSSVGAPTLDSLAALFLHTFATGTSAAFDSIDPDSESRTVLHTAVQRKQTREGNLGRVVWRGPQRAVLLLTGTVRASTGSDETNLVRHFSGFYEAAESGGEWTIARQIPIDTLNHIRSQTLSVDLEPTRSIRVVDTLALSVGTTYGIAMRLNNDVTLDEVKLDGRAANHAFGGGVLWVDAPARPHSTLVLGYRLDAERQTIRDTTMKKVGRPTPAFGAFHNTDVWHPFFGYNSANSLGPATVTVRLPADWRLSTTLPQTETVANGIRTVHGHTSYPAWLLSLIYDRDWLPVTSDVAGVRFETFTAPGFHFTHDSLATALRRIDGILGSRFGGPTPPYVAVVEDRLLGKRGFSVRMTDAVITGSGAETLERLGVLGPTSSFAHEVSHAWTMNATGPAANMLREGWATFAESVVLRAKHGPEVEQEFWERARNGYMLGSEGRLSILGSPDNGGVHYSKGSWIFHMFDLLLGDSAYDRGIRAYVQLQAEAKPAGYQELIAAMSHAAGRDLTTFAMPWFREKYVPDVVARVAGRQLILEQRQPTPPFDLPLEVALTTASGETLRRPVHLTQRADTVDLGADSVTAVHVDPDRHLLMKRHWGEMARFELPVSETAGAAQVALVGDFALDAVPATREGDRWVVTLPLSEGRYVYSWQLDGKPRAPAQGGDPGSEGDPSRTGVRKVQPLELLENPYPR